MTTYKPLPPLDDLQDHFRYNPYTGELKNWYTGTIQTCLDSDGEYIVVNYLGQNWQANRFCYYLGTGEDPKQWQVDHKDRDKINNKLDNLRLLNHSQQQYNIDIKSNNKSGHTGVFWDKKGAKWRAYIVHPEIKGKKIWLYRGDSYDDAVNARKDAEKKYHPDMY